MGDDGNYRSKRTASTNPAIPLPHEFRIDMRSQGYVYLQPEPGFDQLSTPKKRMLREGRIELPTFCALHDWLGVKQTS